MISRFGVLVAVLALAACDRPQDEAAGVASAITRNGAEEAVRPAAAEPGAAAQTGVEERAVKAAGPHGAYDPHAALNAESMIKVALQHHAEGRVSLAMQSIDEAAVRFPADAEVLSVRGSLYLEQGEVARALEDFEASLRLRPDDARTRVNRAQAYRRFDRNGEAMADLDRAVELEPDLLAARFNRGVMFQEQERYAEALADFDRCVAVAPHSPAPYFNRAAAYDALGDRPSAISDLNRFIELTDDDTWLQAANDILRAWREQAEAGAAAGADQAGTMVPSTPPSASTEETP